MVLCPTAADYQEEIWEIAEDCGLEYWGTEGACYVGRSWCAIGEDETGKEFKAWTEKKLAEFFEKSKIHPKEVETWHDASFN